MKKVSVDLKLSFSPGHPCMEEQWILLPCRYTYCTGIFFCANHDVLPSAVPIAAYLSTQQHGTVRYHIKEECISTPFSQLVYTTDCCTAGAADDCPVRVHII